MRMPVGLRLAASAFATVLLLGAGQSLVAATVTVYSNNTAPGDWVVGSGSSNGLTVPLTGSDWKYTDVRQDGFIGIDETKPYNGNGSVLMETTSTTGKAEIELRNLNQGGFGLLKDLEEFSYSWLRSSASDAARYAGPVARLLITNGVDKLGYIVWEQSNNGYRNFSDPTFGPPEDTWIDTNTLKSGANFFTTYGSALGETNGIDNATFNDWVDGTGSIKNAYGDFMVVGINMGIGSGLENTLIGAVDNLTIKFKGDLESTTYNFEVRPIPEPSSIVLSVIGAGALGLICHRRRRGGATA